MLDVEGVSLSFGGVHSLTDVSMVVETGETCAVIGPNGAGKTTLLNVITGLYRSDAGAVRYEGTDLIGTRRSALIGRGVSRTFQNVALFEGMSVLENVQVGAHSRARNGWWLSALHAPPFARNERRSRTRAMEMLELVGIAEVAGASPTGLPYGTLKRVELARALCASPSLLLLDEPAAGLNHHEVGELGDLLRDLKHRMSLTLVLVEHHMGLVMGISDHVVALNFGQVLADGAPRDVAKDPAVVAAYLGSAA